MATQQPTRAWTYTGGYPSTLKLTTLNLDTTAPSDALRVKIAACALNPVDIQMMNLPSWKQPWNALYGKEKGCVCDFSGTVISPGLSGFSEGDGVFGLTLKPFAENGGALGEVADLAEGNYVAVTKPPGWSFEQAAGVSLVYLTAKRNIESVEEYVEASKNKKVAVLGGSSATGIYSIMLAKRKGWSVITTSSGRNKQFVTDTLGADEHVDYTTQIVRQGVAKFEPDAVIDCVGGTECVGLPSSKRYTTIVGDKTSRSGMGGPYLYYDYMSPFLVVKHWTRWFRGYMGWAESYDIEILGMKKEWLEDAKSTLRPDDIFIDSVYKFEEAKEAFERLNTGRARGKVVVKVR